MKKLNNKENIGNVHEGIIGQYIKGKRFFEKIKNTDFSPKELNQSIQKVKGDFVSALNSNYNFFQERTLSDLN